MFKELLTSCLFVFLIHSFTYSQTFEIGIWAGGGTYSMWDLKETQKDLLSDINIPNLAITESFPMYANFGVNLGVDMSNYIITIFTRYESTGSRIGYSDYSGSYFYDQLAKQFLLGSSFKTSSKKHMLAPFFEIKAGFALTSVVFKEELAILDQSDSEKLDLRENALFMEPGVGISIPLKNIKIEPSVSFYFDPIRSGLYLSGEREAKLMDGNDNINTEWIGLRFGINFIVKI